MSSSFKLDHYYYSKSLCVIFILRVSLQPRSLVRKVDNHWKNPRVVDGVVCFVNTYLLDNDSSVS